MGHGADNFLAGFKMKPARGQFTSLELQNHGFTNHIHIQIVAGLEQEMKAKKQNPRQLLAEQVWKASDKRYRVNASKYTANDMTDIARFVEDLRRKGSESGQQSPGRSLNRGNRITGLDRRGLIEGAGGLNGGFGQDLMRGPFGGGFGGRPERQMAPMGFGGMPFGGPLVPDWLVEHNQQRQVDMDMDWERYYS